MSKSAATALKRTRRIYGIVISKHSWYPVSLGLKDPIVSLQHLFESVRAEHRSSRQVDPL